MEASSENPRVSTDTGTEGFDLSAGEVWIYPENYPLRSYQFDIVQSALYNNTLVCLPTGLGKTFIAAVIMYNFWRWYPCGKVVFLAPTKPLVAQQIYACHNVMGIPSDETIELTGSIAQTKRQAAWCKSRVIFATPQVFHNDLEKSIVPAEKVKCVIIDEAHRALGKHSYCECIRLLSSKNEYFRVVGLSATPGNKLDNVHEVLQNLHIAQLELRDETSPDVLPYVNQRKVDIIRVPLSDALTNYKERYILIMDRHVKVLLQYNVLQGHTANISKGRIFHLMREFQNKANKSANHGQIMKTLNILMTMYHAYDLLVRNGLRAFIKFYKNHSDKFWMNDEQQLQQLLGDIERYLGEFPDPNSFGGRVPVIPANVVFGHPKFEKLKEILLRHFSADNENSADTRAIVFVEYRDIVSEVYILLMQLRPTIRPQMFVGQAGQKQKQQKKALEDFRNNHVNVLISTSIGEEGLDVGQVDLIICFDITQNSPIRLVQRMGRTGRKREGHIIILVTDGKEYETLKTTMARRDSLNNRILNTSNIYASLYENNPRMIPEGMKPACHKMHITVQPKAPNEGKKGKRKEKPKEKENEKRSNVRKGKAQSKPTKPSVADWGSGQSKGKGQTTMAKFLTSKRPDDDDFGGASPEYFVTSQNKTQDTIPASDVKLLSRDHEAIEFLTLCALKRSAKESNALDDEIIGGIPYARIRVPARTDFDFSIPEVRVLDCLVYLEDKRRDQVEESEECELGRRLREPELEENEFQEANMNEAEAMNDTGGLFSPVNVVKEANMKEEAKAKEEKEVNVHDQVGALYSPMNDLQEVNVNEEAMNNTGALYLPMNDDFGAEKVLVSSMVESRFEDLLDESDDSVESSEAVVATERNVQNDVNRGNVATSAYIDCRESERNAGSPVLCGGRFEDALNDSSDSLEAIGLEDDTFDESFRPGEGTRNANKQEGSAIKAETNDPSDRMEDSMAIRALEKPGDILDEPATPGTISAAGNGNMATGRINRLLTLEESESLSDADMFEDLWDVQNDLVADWSQVQNDKAIENSNNRSIPLTGAQHTEEEPKEFDWADEISRSSDCKASSSLRTEHDDAKNDKKNDGKHGQMELKVEEFNWDDDAFVIPAETSVCLKGNTTFKSTVGEGKDSKAAATGSDPNDTGWIATDKMSLSKRGVNVSRASIAKKLSRFRSPKAANSSFRRPAAENLFETVDDFDEDFVINSKEERSITDKENSFFFDSAEGENRGNTSASSAESNRGLLSLKRAKDNKNVTFDMHVFAAPQKYLSKQTKQRPREETVLTVGKEPTKRDKERQRTEKEPAKIRDRTGVREKNNGLKRTKNQFICDEASVSSDASPDESIDEDDGDLSSFVSYTQTVHDTTDMHAHYLQSIRSPVKNSNFVFKRTRTPDPCIEIYSQQPSDTEDIYANDSFCVAVDEEPSETSVRMGEYSILERAEQELRRKRRKRCLEGSQNAVRKKRVKRPTVLNDSFSSEDETEKLRRQVQDESLYLKGACHRS